MPLNKKKYSKQVILFLVAVILPSLVLVIFTLRMLDQERELLEKRSLEQRDLLVSNISSQLLSYLEQIKFEEVNSESRTFGKKQYRHPEVVLLAHLDGHDLQLPWKPVTGENLSPLLEPGFREGVANGEYSEFATGDLESAVRIYGKNCWSG